MKSKTGLFLNDSGEAVHAGRGGNTRTNVRAPVSRPIESSGDVAGSLGARRRLRTAVKLGATDKKEIARLWCGTWHGDFH